MRKNSLKLIRLWDSLISSSKNITDSETRKKARLLSTFILASGIPFILLTYIRYRFIMQTSVGIFEILAYTLVLAIYILSRTRHYSLTVALIFITVMTVVFGGILTGEVLDLPTQITLLVLNYFLAVALLNIRQAVLLAVIQNLGIFCLMFLLPQITWQEVLDPAIINMELTILMLVVMIYRDSLERVNHNQLMVSELRYKSIFEDSPIALLEFNAEELKYRLTETLSTDVHRMELFFKDRPGAFQELKEYIRLVNMNQLAAEMLKVKFGRTPEIEVISRIFDNLNFSDVRTILLELSAKGTVMLEDPINLTCCDDTYVILKASVAQGFSNTWERIFFSLVDVSEVVRSKKAMQDSYDATLEGWVRALDMRDKETEGHAQRVTKLTTRFARIVGLPENQIEHVRRGAILHDIGKLSISDRILTKPDKLTDEERRVMKMHPLHSEELLIPIEYLRPALDIPRFHHERWDGTGYPYGLKEEEIPLAARLFAIVDVWDALTSDRHYRNAWSQDRAIEHLQEGAGSHFDPKLVEIFIEFCI